jgi:hypothetical protein
LVHQEWAEVKTLVMGTVEPPVLNAKRGERVVHSTDLSYFSRLADAETFGRLALVETHQRRTEPAQQVCAVTDGAEWEQGFVNLHRCDATRILDFGHSSGYVAAAGQAVLGEGTAATQDWLKATLHELKQGEPDTVLMPLHDMHPEMSARGADAATVAHTIQKSLDYLEKRRGPIEYARFQALGYPIGSGSVESANKLVVEARLQGAGMHWAPVHVNPMLALRNMACSDRWQEAWPPITQRLRQEERAARLHRHQKRQAKRSSTILVALPAIQAVAPSSSRVPSAPVIALSTRGELVASPENLVPKKPYRPAADHPWRHSPIGRARFKPSRCSGEAKL